ncbi:GNAT family N-acetyltransferase [Saccharopolyspora sp. TS4A08]|uniref:GNAT family N-acetyltransferase n=1 Tax=Saccharopolyspora ipomoeae TaxID=3042027 RepID=A0ABT6PUC6_9PSEU|nr:GNAT family N-acetyltransferase [Saccharopolyspora sp. TS4A08]MDI2031238.1 GNAT family N-acetyltransferase [Saccharopolyspora sp. TS4A08]
MEEGEVAASVDAIVGALDPRTCRVLMAWSGEELVGWLVIRRDTFALVSHWGTVNHVQSRPERRGEGVGTALMVEARRVARDEMGLEQLHLAARAGIGLGRFYGRLGWEEIGRWPGALRLGPDDDRDEVLMFLQL